MTEAVNDKGTFGKRCSKSNSNEIILPDGCSHVNLLYSIRTPFCNTSGEILMKGGNANKTFEHSRVFLLLNLDEAVTSH